MEYNISKKMMDMKPSAIREIFKSLTDPHIIAFAAGNPSPESFPVEAIQRFSADILANQAYTALQYSITEGYPRLREAVAARQKKLFGVGRDGDLTVITSGGQQALELSCKVMCDEGRGHL
jgi:2-aminoadipate transaminase